MIAHSTNSHLKFMHKSIKYDLSYFPSTWNWKQVSTSPLIRDAVSNPKCHCTLSHHLLDTPCNTTKQKQWCPPKPSVLVDFFCMQLITQQLIACSQYKGSNHISVSEYIIHTHTHTHTHKDTIYMLKVKKKKNK